ncbi:hypothetical protein [Streptomyces sp. DH10]|uniref:hypothetical protein n=1 Tax=Streptomyces sp. DH10 TaxID=3040121 RepID=UPI00244150D1|nr:hypothetical protein [Streptomyces sp. DH10]MDG9709008.1 hypothetical protein [Streptomyces sp. DH10]
MRATFEDRLLDELKQEIRLRESAETGPADVRTGEHEAKARLRRFPAPRRIAVLAAACAAAWLAAVVVPGSPGDSKAYAVERVGDGSVKLTVKEQSISVAAQQELARKVRPWGIQVAIDVLAPGHVCERSKVTPLPAIDKHGNRVPLIPLQAGWDVTLRRGNVLAFENTRGDSRPRAVELYATKREAEPCVPVKVSLSDARSGPRR